MPQTDYFEGTETKNRNTMMAHEAERETQGKGKALLLEQSKAHSPGKAKWVYSGEYVKYSLFLYCYLLIIALFSIRTMVSLLLPHPVFAL